MWVLIHRNGTFKKSLSNAEILELDNRIPIKIVQINPRTVETKLVLGFIS